MDLLVGILDLTDCLKREEQIQHTPSTPDYLDSQEPHLLAPPHVLRPTPPLPHTLILHPPGTPHRPDQVGQPGVSFLLNSSPSTRRSLE